MIEIAIDAIRKIDNKKDAYYAINWSRLFFAW